MMAKPAIPLNARPLIATCDPVPGGQGATPRNRPVAMLREYLREASLV